jgi:CHAT domain-containing protein
MTELPGDDLHGLQSAFFAGGAAEIVGALFPGDDEPARTICVEFHRRRVAGDPADIALAIAVRRFLKNGNRLETGRKYWAPFFLTAVGPNAPLVPGRENHQRRET